MQPRRSCRRFLARSLVLIAAGALTTTIVAWLAYLAHRTEPPWRTFNGMFEGWFGNDHGRMPQLRLPSANGMVFVFYSGGVGYDCVQITPSWGGGVPDPIPDEWFEVYHDPSVVPAQEAALYPGAPYAIPTWAFMPARDTTARSVDTHAAGWPMLALKYASEQHVVMGPPGTRARIWYTTSWGLPVSRWFSRWASGDCLPLRPMPLGFAADTALFGALAWAAARGARGLRSFWRRRRGRCPRCSYDLRGLPAGAVCPECGRPAAGA